MFRKINWVETLLGWALVVLGLKDLVVFSIGVYMVNTGQILPGQPMFLNFVAPDLWDGIEQISGALISLIFGTGCLYLVKMRIASHLDDMSRGK